MKDQYDRSLDAALRTLEASPDCYRALDSFGNILVEAGDAGVCARHLDQYVHRANKTGEGSK